MNNEKKDHVVYLDVKAKELEKIIDGSKTMIIRGATGRKLPYGRVNPEDTLYFINNNAEGSIKAKAIVETVYNSEKLTEVESITLVNNNQNRLQLTDTQFKKWASKRYIVLIGIKNIEPISPFPIDKSKFGNMDDWLAVENIQNIKIQ